MRTHSCTSARLAGRTMAGMRRTVAKVAVSASRRAASPVITCPAPTVSAQARRAVSPTVAFIEGKLQTQHSACQRKLRHSGDKAGRPGGGLLHLLAANYRRSGECLAEL